MDLHYWPSALKWGLPSFDIHSLHLLSYIKFSGADVSLHPSLQSWFSKENKVLPSMKTQNDGIIEKPEHIISYLKGKGFDPDKGFDIAIMNNIFPFSTLIEERILPAVISAIWVDTTNYKDVAHCAYAKSCRYPSNFVTPNKLQKKEENYLRELKFWSDEIDSKSVEKMESDAKSALNLISEFLGEKEYLLGKDPSSLDALLFSILAPLFKLPLVSCKLQNHLRGCVNLCQYITRILQKYFQQELINNTDSSQGLSVDDEPKLDGLDWKRDWLFPVAVATIAMLSYAANAGLLHGKK